MLILCHLHKIFNLPVKTGSGGHCQGVSVWFMAKMLLSPERRAYFCMSYLMVMISQHKRISVFLVKRLGFGRMTSASRANCWSSLAVLAASRASLRLPRVLFHRSAATSSDSRFDWQKWGLGSMSRGSSEATFEKCGSRLSAVHILVYHRQSSV